MIDKAGIYVHFPFCIKKCLYCGFYSIPHNNELENKYIDCLIKEIYLQKNLAKNLHFGSIYLGGGTPSLMSNGNRKNLMFEIFKNFKIKNNAEITIEVNPASVNDQQIKKIGSSKINRISLGIQSFDDSILNYLGRPHTSKDAVKTYNSFLNEGFANINCDLIFAIPGQTMDQWKNSLRQLINLSQKHISLYSFSFDKGTYFTKCYQDGKISPIAEDIECAMYEYAIKFLSDNGYIHYEISNFALPGFESNHNKLYWKNNSYIGLGAAAFSYVNQQRYSAVDNVNEYIKFLKNNKKPYNYSEILDDEKSLRETAALNLRLIKEGINLKKLQTRYKNLKVIEILKKQLDKLVEEGLLVTTGDNYILTPRGVLVADETASCIV